MVLGKITMSSSSPLFWRVTVQRYRNVHLIPLAPGQASGTTALCGQSLSEDERPGLQDRVVVPLGNECEKCLIMSGFFKRKEAKPLTPLQRMMQDLAEMSATLDEFDYTKDEKKVLLQKVFDFYIDLGMTRDGG
jgi:hypothetical protein